MWNLKFRVKNVDSVYSPLTEKFDVKDYFYPIDRYRKGNKILILSIHVLQGSLEERKKFCKKMKSENKVKRYERAGDRVLVLIEEEEKFYELLYDPEIYLPSPVLIEKGVEHWSIASWDRKVLEGILEEMGKWKDKLKNFELLGIRQLDLKEIYFPKIMPELPEKQKEVFRIAIESGYYRFPRDVDLADLAKRMKITTQTYHEHLRKAEAKLLPFFAGNNK